MGGDFADLDSVQRTGVDVSTSGDTTVVAAQGAGKRILVCAFKIVSAASVTVRFKSGNGNNISASYSLGINDDLTFDWCPYGWFRTNANEAFVVNQSLAISSAAQVLWIIV